MARNTGETDTVGNGAEGVDILVDDPNADTGSVAAILNDPPPAVEDPVHVVLDITTAGLTPADNPIRMEFSQNTGGILSAWQAHQLSMDLRMASDAVVHLQKMKALDKQ